MVDVVFVVECFGYCFVDCDVGIFDGVVLVDMQVVFGVDVQVDQ